MSLPAKLAIVLALGLSTGSYVTTLYVTHQAQIDGWEDDVATCHNLNRGRDDAAGRDQDLAGFAARAAIARKADGDLKVAASYRRTATRSYARRDRTLARKVDCAAAFPKPDPLLF